MIFGRDEATNLRMKETAVKRVREEQESESESNYD